MPKNQTNLNALDLGSPSRFGSGVIIAMLAQERSTNDMLKEVLQRLENIEKDVKDLKEDVKDLKEDVKDLKEDVKDLKEKMTVVEHGMVTVNARLTRLEGNAGLSPSEAVSDQLGEGRAGPTSLVAVNEQLAHHQSDGLGTDNRLPKVQSFSDQSLINKYFNEHSSSQDRRLASGGYGSLFNRSLTPKVGEVRQVYLEHPTMNQGRQVQTPVINWDETNDRFKTKELMEFMNQFDNNVPPMNEGMLEEQDDQQGREQQQGGAHEQIQDRHPHN